MKKKAQSGVKAPQISQEKREREELYRELTEEQPDVYAITLEEAPVTLQSLLPDYRYRFDGKTCEAGDDFVSGFAKFMETNAYLAMDDVPTRAFADGFARAVAMTALYMDSLSINPP